MASGGLRAEFFPQLRVIVNDGGPPVWAAVNDALPDYSFNGDDRLHHIAITRPPKPHCWR